MDVRELKNVLDCSRSTVQRNLTVLKEQGWVKETHSRYTTTIIGSLLHEEFARMNETLAALRRMAPFFETVVAPPPIGIGRLKDALVTTPDPTQPNAPTKRLFSTFTNANRVRGCVPIVSRLIVESFREMTEDRATTHEYVLSRNAFDAIHAQCGDKYTDVSETLFPNRTEVVIYEGDIPYGLFVSEGQLALTAYTEVGRVRALVESTSEEAIEWGKEMYEIYRDQSAEPPDQIHQSEHNNAELID